MAKNKRSKFQIARDRAFISEKHLEGLGPTQIAFALNRRRPYNLSESQIRYDIKQISNAWKEEYLTDYDTYVAKEIAKVNKIERAAWKAWARSRRDKKKVTRSESSMSGTGNLNGTQESDSRKEVTERTPGDKKFMEIIQWCSEQRWAINGKPAAKRVNITWQEKAKQLGIKDTDQMKERLVKEFVDAANAKRVEK